MPSVQLKIKRYGLPPVDPEQVCRYMQAPSSALDGSQELLELIRSCESEAAPVLTPMAVMTELPIARLESGALDLGFAVTESQALLKRLEGCSRIILFAATVGIGHDRLIKKYSRVSPARALCLQGLGAERVEALCDTLCLEIAKEYKAEGYSVTERFSPGYSDLPLTLQKDIFAVLSCPRTIGLTLNESCLMSPSKSVTAIVGLKAEQ